MSKVYSELVRVNGRSVSFQEAASALDLLRIVDRCLLQSVAEARRVDLSEVRHLLVGAEAERAFAADPWLFDEITIAAFPAPTDIEALLWTGDVDAGAPFYAVAERELSASGRALSFQKVQRVDLLPLSITDDSEWELRPGRTVAAALGDAGPHVVLVHAVRPAEWNTGCRVAVEERLLARWLEAARTRAHVAWTWGQTASAAPRRRVSEPSASSC